MKIKNLLNNLLLIDSLTYYENFPVILIQFHLSLGTQKT